MVKNLCIPDQGTNTVVGPKLGPKKNLRTRPTLLLPPHQRSQISTTCPGPNAQVVAAVPKRGRWQRVPSDQACGGCNRLGGTQALTQWPQMLQCSLGRAVWSRRGSVPLVPAWASLSATTNLVATGTVTQVSCGALNFWELKVGIQGTGAKCSWTELKTLCPA